MGMKCPRFSLGAIGFAILFLAIDFAVIRSALFGGGREDWTIFAFLLLPMLDALLIALFRLRRPGRRTTGAIAFFIVGTVATLVVFVSCFIAPEAALGILSTIGRPIALASINGLTRLFGNSAMQHCAMQVSVGIAFELLFPIALFCFSPLLIALLGRRLAPRLWPLQQIAGAGFGGSDSVSGIA
jgi:hypothetical protein